MVHSKLRVVYGAAWIAMCRTCNYVLVQHSPFSRGCRLAKHSFAKERSYPTRFIALYDTRPAGFDRWLFVGEQGEWNWGRDVSANIFDGDMLPRMNRPMFPCLSRCPVVGPPVAINDWSGEIGPVERCRTLISCRK